MNNTTINDVNIVTADNQTDLINLVNLVTRSTAQYGLGFIWLMGNIGSIFNCIIFRRPTFRHSPCAMYFFASSFSQFFTFNFVLFTRMLQFGYNVQAVNIYHWFCKLRYYLFYICVGIPRYNIILASIDRYFSSSRDALRRQWSSPRIAIRFIIGNIVFWCLIYIQVIVFYDIIDGNCQFQPGIYGKFFSIYISIDSGVLPIFLMVVFGLLTVKNVHQTRRRISPTVRINVGRPARADRMSKKDSQFHKMLANQIILFIILNIPNPCFLLYQSFTIDTDKSPLRLSVETCISNMTYVFIHLGFASTFLNFLVTSKLFRREFQQVIQTKILGRPPNARNDSWRNNSKSCSENKSIR